MSKQKYQPLYLCIGVNSERTVPNIIASTHDENEAKAKMKEDFLEVFMDKYDEPFVENDTDSDYGLEENMAWINDHHHVDYDWYILTIHA